jgi:DUF917 family protein
MDGYGNQVSIEDGLSIPTVHLELRGAQTKQLDKVEAGATVEVVLKGKVVSVTERDEEGVYSGSCCIEYTRLKLLPDNEFSELVEDD